MPELPEVETVRRGLERLLVGRTIRQVQVYEAKSLPLVPPGADPVRLAASGWRPPASLAEVGAYLTGAVVTGVRRRAKLLILDLDNDCSLLGHLKMTGQMVVRGPENWGAGHPTDSLLAQLPDRSSRLQFDFDSDTALFFNDQRKFGWLALLPTAQVDSLPFIAQLGPEPLDESGVKEFCRRLERHSRTGIKAALLNQTIVAGIGNIYADESLWAVRLHPACPVMDVSAVKRRRLYQAAGEVMQVSLAAGGSTDRNYVDAEGRRGSYLSFAHVFRREGRPCSRCGTTIVKLRVAGRGTHICPHCQKL